MRCNCPILRVLAAACILPVLTGCEKWTTTPESLATRPGPKITFEKVVHDFGEVGPQMRKGCEFKFENSGDSLLKISGVEVCCGVKAELDKYDYAPGERGVLKVEYRATSQLGSDEKHFYVRSNDWGKPAVTLTLKSNVVPRVEWEPTNLKLALNKPNAGCPQITIKGLDGKPFAITAFKSTGDCINADIVPAVQATEFVLEPKVDLEKLQKNLSGRIDITGTHPEWGEVTIPFDVLPRFTVNPSMIIVFKAKAREPTVRNILVLNNYGEDFEVESTSSENNLIRVQNQKKVDNGYQLEVEIIPPDVQGATSFADKFLVNIKGREQLTVPCRGFY